MKSIAVFCSSGMGNEEIFQKEAFRTGQEIAKRNLTLIYGGAKVGLMGKVADGALSAGGKVIGVLPHFLANREIAHPHLSEIIYVENMNQRKQTVHDLSDASITLPGGFGSMEELFEKLSWKQLGLHHQPIGLLNINSFYSSLLENMQKMVDQEFLNPISFKDLKVESCPELLISMLIHETQK
jgi:uncharacterized protein (TIGR00730 family)